MKKFRIETLPIVAVYVALKILNILFGDPITFMLTELIEHDLMDYIPLVQSIFCRLKLFLFLENHRLK